MVRGDLTGHRIDNGDHIRAVIQVDVGRLDADTGAIINYGQHLVLIVKHFEKDVVAGEMQRQCERPADQPVKRGIAADLFFQRLERLHNHRKASFGFIQHGQVRSFSAFSQRMTEHRRRDVIRPAQPATQNFSLHLQIEHDRQAVRLVEFPGLHQAGNQQVGRLKIFRGRFADQKTAVAADKRQPCRARGFLSFQGRK